MLSINLSLILIVVISAMQPINGSIWEKESCDTENEICDDNPATVATTESTVTIDATVTTTTPTVDIEELEEIYEAVSEASILRENINKDTAIDNCKLVEIMALCGHESRGLIEFSKALNLAELKNACCVNYEFYDCLTRTIGKNCDRKTVREYKFYVSFGINFIEKEHCLRFPYGSPLCKSHETP